MPQVVEADGRDAGVVHDPPERLVHGMRVDGLAVAVGQHPPVVVYGNLLIKDGIPVKVVSERLGHANITLTMQTYQRVLPGMQADAADCYQRLTAPTPPAARHGGTSGSRRKTAEPGKRPLNDEGPGP